MKITVACDEKGTINVMGELSGQFHSLGEEGVADYLAFSDGTLLEVTRLEDGDWSILPVRFGEFTSISMIDPEAGCSNCSDVLTLDGDIKWVVFGIGLISQGQAFDAVERSAYVETLLQQAGKAER